MAAATTAALASAQPAIRGSRSGTEPAARKQLAGTTAEPQPESAVIVGFGPVGQTAVRILREFGVRPIVVDLNLDTVRQLVDAGDIAVYGDATQRDILEAAGIRQAKYLLVTIPEVLARTVVVLTATDLNPNVRVFARAGTSRNGLG